MEPWIEFDRLSLGDVGFDGWGPRGKEETAAIGWMMARPSGITIGDLPTSQVHPSRLLAELAEEFDKTRPPLALLLAAQTQVFKMATHRTD